VVRRGAGKRGSFKGTHGRIRDVERSFGDHVIGKRVMR
jgi:hypothetical protein